MLSSAKLCLRFRSSAGFRPAVFTCFPPPRASPPGQRAVRCFPYHRGTARKVRSPNPPPSPRPDQARESGPVLAPVYRRESGHRPLQNFGVLPCSCPRPAYPRPPSRITCPAYGCFAIRYPYRRHYGDQCLNGRCLMGPQRAVALRRNGRCPRVSVAVGVRIPRTTAGDSRKCSQCILSLIRVRPISFSC